MLEAFWALAAIVVPWALGSGIVRFSLPSAAHSATTLVLGIGFPLGMYLAAGIMALSIQAGLGLLVRPILAVMVALVFLAWWIPNRKAEGLTHQEHAGAAGGIWISCFLIAIAAITVSPILIDVWLRPLFPWDAWYSYAIKAKIIFSLETFPEIVSPRTWKQGGGGNSYFISTAHPLTISLIQSWMAGSVGRWSESLVNLPWPALLLSLAFVVHGTISTLTKSSVRAVLAFGLILTVPAYGIHAVLAGYLDLWLTTWLAILTALICLWMRDGGWRLALLAGMATAGCLFSKDTAIAYLIPLAFGILLGLISSKWRLRAVVISVFLLLGGMLFFALIPEPTLYLSLGGYGNIGFVDGVLEAPFVRDYELTGSHSVWPILFESMLFSRNFNLLGWFVLLMTSVAIATLQRSRYSALLIGFMLAMVAVLYFTLGYTQAGEVVALGTVDLRILLPATTIAACISICLLLELTAEHKTPFQQ